MDRNERRRVTRREVLKGSVAGLAGLSAVGLFGACTPSGTPSATSTVGPSGSSVALGAPKRGGELIAARSVEAQSLEPHMDPTIPRAQLTALLYNKLVKTDQSLAIVPDLAESWSTPDDTTFLFNLRRGVKFHNGRELVADDVIYSVERILDPKTGSQGAGFLGSIAAIDSPSPLVVRIKLKAPDAALLTGLASAWGAIVPKEVVQAKGDLKTTAVGTGPFMLQEWVKDSFISFQRNPNYFEPGLPYLDSIRSVVIPEEANIVAGLRGGTVHWTLFGSNTNYTLVKDDTRLTVLRSPRIGFQYFMMHNQRPPFTKLEVRQAIAMTVDRSAILQAAAGGLGQVVGPIPPALKQWALPVTEYEFYKPNADKAKQLLATAGYPNGFTTTMVCIATGGSKETATVVADQLKQIGITVNIIQVDVSVYVQRFNGADFDMIWGQTGGNEDPESLIRSRLYSGSAAQQNQPRWQNAAADALIDQGKKTLDPAKRKVIYDELQRLLIQQSPQVWTFSPDLIEAMQNWVKGYVSHPSSFSTGLATAWIDK